MAEASLRTSWECCQIECKIGKVPPSAHLSSLQLCNQELIASLGCFQLCPKLIKQATILICFLTGSRGLAVCFPLGLEASWTH